MYYSVRCNWCLYKEDMNLNDVRVYSLCNIYLENNENFFGSIGNYRDIC